MLPEKWLVSTKMTRKKRKASNQKTLHSRYNDITLNNLLHSLIINVAVDSIVCGDRHICSAFTEKTGAVFMFVVRVVCFLYLICIWIQIQDSRVWNGESLCSIDQWINEKWY